MWLYQMRHQASKCDNIRPFVTQCTSSRLVICLCFNAKWVNKIRNLRNCKAESLKKDNLNSTRSNEHCGNRAHTKPSTALISSLTVFPYGTHLFLNYINWISKLCAAIVILIHPIPLILRKLALPLTFQYKKGLIVSLYSKKLSQPLLYEAIN